MKLAFVHGSLRLCGGIPELPDRSSIEVQEKWCSDKTGIFFGEEVAKMGKIKSIEVCKI